MRSNALLKTFREAGVAGAAFVTVPDPFVAEVMAGSGMDVLIVDTEHSVMSLEQVQNVLIALHPSESTVIVRVPASDEIAIQRALDLGAEGVLVPGVRHADECRAAVRSAFYPPKGERGFGPRRASRLYGDRADYLRRANDEIAVLVMVESAQAVEAIDEIVRVPGLSGVFIGLADLAVSMGYLHDLANPAVDAAAQTIAKTAVREGLPYGVFTGTHAAAERWVARGAQLITLGSDLLYLDAGIAASRSARARLARDGTGIA
jgi:2-keto-3-deoxy-L-rhamnonate aldolase RhmA